MNELIASSAVDYYAELIRADYNVPGLALAIVKDDTILLAKGYGVCKMGGKKPVNAGTRFGIASISKSFTAMALGMLVDEGKLDWSDPVTKHIPSFQLQDAYASREFTIRDLLVHRSGLPTVAGGTLWYGSKLSRDQVMAGIRHLKPVSSFRSEYAYQNITYLIAGQIIPALTGRSWDDFVRERIFAPLGMHHSNTSIHAEDKSGNIAQAHVDVDEDQRTVALRDYDNVGPAASINTTALDLSAYARLLLNNGRFAGRQLYSPQIGADLWTPHTVIPIARDSPTAYAPFMPRYHNAYGLGWVIQDIPGRWQKKVFHSGGIDGLRSLLTLLPDENLGIIVFANNEGPAPAIMTQLILDLYWGESESAWYSPALQERKQESEKQEKEVRKEKVNGTMPSLSLERYAGSYHSKLIRDLTLIFEQGQLTLCFPQTPSFKACLSHWHYDTFRLQWHDPLLPEGLVTFILDAQGRISELRLDQPNLLDVDFSELHPIKRKL